MNDKATWHEAACHCGAVRSARRCSCSTCLMRGAVAVTARLGDIEFLRGEGNLTLYTFNTGTAKHYFCRACGIYTHHQRRSNSEELGINVACLDGVSPFDFPEVQVLDGGHHPRDGGSGTGRVGILGSEPAEGISPP